MDQLQSHTPKRSILYVPGSNERALQKIKALDADGYILDLEDAVAPNMKEDARDIITNFCRNCEHEKQKIIIRINGLETQWGEEDMKAVCKLNPAAVLIPKVEKQEEVGRVDELMNDFGAIEDTKIWAMIETPSGILNAQEIATSYDRLDCLVMGTSDLVNDLRASHTGDRTPLLYSLSHTILAARAAGKDIIDGVHLDLLNSEGFLKSCQQGKELGFDGKSLIHPNQIETANQIYGNSPEDIEYAKRIITAFDQAILDGKGVAVLDGKLIENLHVENAKRVIQTDKIINNRK